MLGVKPGTLRPTSRANDFAAERKRTLPVRTVAHRRQEKEKLGRLPFAILFFSFSRRREQRHP